jgi:hypothetical protein
LGTLVKSHRVPVRSVALDDKELCPRSLSHRYGTEQRSSSSEHGNAGSSSQTNAQRRSFAGERQRMGQVGVLGIGVSSTPSPRERIEGRKDLGIGPSDGGSPCLSAQCVHVPHARTRREPVLLRPCCSKGRNRRRLSIGDEMSLLVRAGCARQR